MSMKKVELLSPAGCMEAFYGALHAGADAIYLAGSQFGARAFADNFSKEEIKQAITFAHLFDVRIYLAANVLIRQEELPSLVSFVRELYEAGLDGVIVQDLGAAMAIKRACPMLSLHASTQMSITTSYGVSFLQSLGFTRVVPARELSLFEIRSLKEETGIEVETFIHGAMCYSYSGRCLMSSFLGGRSGNRGRCAGTCRLPYEILDEDKKRLGQKFLADQRENASKGKSFCERDFKGNNTGRKSERKVPEKDIENGSKKKDMYPLSMRDLFVLPMLPELLDAGIDSFKIEGRMKKPEYAAGVTAIYRKYIDLFYDWDEKGRPGKWEIAKEDLDAILGLYIRSDLSMGYYKERNGRDLLTIGKGGYRGADPLLLKTIRSSYIETRKRIPITGTARIAAKEAASLCVSVQCQPGMQKSYSYVATGDQVLEALNKPLMPDSIREKLTKTGESPFFFSELSIETDGRAFLPVSSLGALRRKALEGLQNKMLQDMRKNTGRSKENDFREEGEALLAKADKKDRSFSKEEVFSGFSQEAPVLISFVQSAGQARALLDSGARILVLDGALLDHPLEVLTEAGEQGALVLAALPHILRSSDFVWLDAFLSKYGKKFYGVVTRNLEELEFLKEREYDNTVIADSMLYCWNVPSLECLESFSDLQILPLELGRAEMEKTFAGAHKRLLLSVYGRAPMMVSAGCVKKTAGLCPKDLSLTGRDNADQDLQSDGFFYLKDRMGSLLPVAFSCSHCQNVIYNSVPTSLLNMRGDTLMRRVRGLVLSFTTESPRVCKDIFGQFQGSLQNVQESTNKMREKGMDFTYGHYKKGAL